MYASYSSVSSIPHTELLISSWIGEKSDLAMAGRHLRERHCDDTVNTVVITSHFIQLSVSSSKFAE